MHEGWGRRRGCGVTVAVLVAVWACFPDGGAGAGTRTVTHTLTPSATLSVTPSWTLTVTRSLTPSASITLTNTVTLSVSPSATHTISLTVTSTDTPTPTHSETLTATFTDTGTSTLTVTPTATPTHTFSLTQTDTLTPTHSDTLTETATLTLTSTLTVTASMTLTQTDTLTPTHSETLTKTFTVTPTDTLTVTSTMTLTQTFTLTGTDTPTPTHSETLTATFTDTGTSTLTVTPTATPIHTFSLTQTDTLTPTHSDTLTETATLTLTNTLTVTPSATQSPSHTMSQTPTPSMTPSVSITLTMTATLTVTATVSPSATLTVSRTLTDTVTQTVTSSATPSSTPTLSPTVTPSATQSLTMTLTETTLTATESLTLTQTATPSMSATSTSTLTSTGTDTLSVTPSATLSPTSSITLTQTMTLTATATVSVTHTATLSPTRSASLTHTDTPSLTSSITVSATASPTSTMTLTPSSTASVTTTLTLPTATASLTLTMTLPTPTATATSTASRSTTETLTPTFSATLSPTHTQSLTATQSVTGTFTLPTPTASLTFTLPTPSVSATLTATSTRSVSPTPTLPTPTPTKSVASATATLSASSTMSRESLTSTASRTLPTVTATAQPTVTPTQPTATTTPTLLQAPLASVALEVPGPVAPGIYVPIVARIANSASATAGLLQVHLTCTFVASVAGCEATASTHVGVVTPAGTECRRHSSGVTCWLHGTSLPPSATAALSGPTCYVPDTACNGTLTASATATSGATPSVTATAGYELQGYSLQIGITPAGGHHTGSMGAPFDITASVRNAGPGVAVRPFVVLDLQKVVASGRSPISVSGQRVTYTSTADATTAADTTPIPAEVSSLLNASALLLRAASLCPGCSVSWRVTVSLPTLSDDTLGDNTHAANPHISGICRAFPLHHGVYPRLGNRADFTFSPPQGVLKISGVENLTATGDALWEQRRRDVAPMKRADFTLRGSPVDLQNASSLLLSESLVSGMGLAPFGITPEQISVVHTSGSGQAETLLHVSVTTSTESYPALAAHILGRLAASASGGSPFSIQYSQESPPISMSEGAPPGVVSSDITLGSSETISGVLRLSSISHRVVTSGGGEGEIIAAAIRDISRAAQVSPAQLSATLRRDPVGTGVEIAWTASQVPGGGAGAVVRGAEAGLAVGGSLPEVAAAYRRAVSVANPVRFVTHLPRLGWGWVDSPRQSGPYAAGGSQGGKFSSLFAADFANLAGLPLYITSGTSTKVGGVSAGRSSPSSRRDAAVASAGAGVRHVLSVTPMPPSTPSTSGFSEEAIASALRSSVSRLPGALGGTQRGLGVPSSELEIDLSRSGMIPGATEGVLSLQMEGGGSTVSPTPTLPFDPAQDAGFRDTLREDLASAFGVDESQVFITPPPGSPPPGEREHLWYLIIPDVSNGPDPPPGDLGNSEEIAGRVASAISSRTIPLPKTMAYFRAVQPGLTSSVSVNYTGTGVFNTPSPSTLAGGGGGVTRQVVPLGGGSTGSSVPLVITGENLAKLGGRFVFGPFIAQAVDPATGGHGCLTPGLTRCAFQLYTSQAAELPGDWDADASGSLSESEVRAGVAGANRLPPQGEGLPAEAVARLAESIYASYDTDGDRVISVGELGGDSPNQAVSRIDPSRFRAGVSASRSPYAELVFEVPPEFRVLSGNGSISRLKTVNHRIVMQLVTTAFFTPEDGSLPERVVRGFSDGGKTVTIVQRSAQRLQSATPPTSSRHGVALQGSSPSLTPTSIQPLRTVDDVTVGFDPTSTRSLSGEGFVGFPGGFTEYATSGVRPTGGGPDVTTLCAGACHFEVERESDRAERWGSVYFLLLSYIVWISVLLLLFIVSPLRPVKWKTLSEKRGATGAGGGAAVAPPSPSSDSQRGAQAPPHHAAVATHFFAWGHALFGVFTPEHAGVRHARWTIFFAACIFGFLADAISFKYIRGGGGDGYTGHPWDEELWAASGWTTLLMLAAYVPLCLCEASFTPPLRRLEFWRRLRPGSPTHPVPERDLGLTLTPSLSQVPHPPGHPAEIRRVNPLSTLSVSALRSPLGIPAAQWGVGTAVQGMMGGDWESGVISKREDNRVDVAWSGGGFSFGIPIPGPKHSPGDRVDAIFEGRPHPATVIAQDPASGTYNLDWEDGTVSYGIPEADIHPSSRVREEAVHSPVSPISPRGTPPSLLRHEFALGEPVSAVFDGEWFPGEVCKLNPDGSYNIDWGDGTGSDGVPPRDVLPRGGRAERGVAPPPDLGGGSPPVGANVAALFDGEWHPASVCGVNADGTYDVDWGSGEGTAGLHPSCIRPRHRAGDSVTAVVGGVPRPARVLSPTNLDASGTPGAYTVDLQDAPGSPPLSLPPHLILWGSGSGGGPWGIHRSAVVLQEPSGGALDMVGGYSEHRAPPQMGGSGGSPGYGLEEKGEGMEEEEDWVEVASWLAVGYFTTVLVTLCAAAGVFYITRTFSDAAMDRFFAVYGVAMAVFFLVIDPLRVAILRLIGGSLPRQVLPSLVAPTNAFNADLPQRLDSFPTMAKRA